MKKILLYSLFILIGLVIFTTLFFTVRQGIANVQIERDGQVLPTSVPNLAKTTRLEIVPLYEEASAEESFDFGHGVSYLIRTDSATILMDLGNNPTETARLPSLQNMQTLGIGWDEIDAIVISHPHPDHVGGVKPWEDRSISFADFTGYLSVMPIYVPTSMKYPGATLVHSEQPTLISKDIATTGVISYSEVYPLSLFNPKGYEQGLVIHVAGQGLVMITGCGHPTLETLVLRAEELYGEEVAGVVGGLHYEKFSAEDAQPHIQFLEPRQPKLVALSPHDSSPEALTAFHLAFSEAYRFIKVGEPIRFP